MHTPDLFPFSLPPGDPDERVERWLDGDLPPEEAEQVAAAVREDAAWARAAQTARHLRLALRATPAATAPPDFASGVMRAVAHHEKAQRQAQRQSVRDTLRLWLRVPVWQPALALAVTLLVAVALWPRATPPTEAEVAASLEEVRWTLAYLSHTSQQTGELVRDRVLAPHVVAPVQRALNTSDTDIPDLP